MGSDSNFEDATCLILRVATGDFGMDIDGDEIPIHGVIR
jgi:hypothetical protein